MGLKELMDKIMPGKVTTAPAQAATTAVAAPAQAALGGRAYQLYVQEAKAMGETPKSPEDWAKEQKK